MHRFVVQNEVNTDIATFASLKSLDLNILFKKVLGVLVSSVGGRQRDSFMHFIVSTLNTLV